MNKTEEILDSKESYDFLRGANRVLVRVAMKEHTRRQMAELREEIAPLLEKQMELVKEYGQELYKCEQLPADQILSEIFKLNKQIIQTIEEIEK